MHRAGRRWRVVWRRLVEALGDFFTVRMPSEASLESHVAGLVESLNLRAETTSYVMALADESFDRLQEAIDSHEALGRQAEAFYRAGAAEKARRCVSLQVQLRKRLDELQRAYEAYQNDAERHLALFCDQEREVQLKSVQLPKLQDDLRLITMQERLQQLEARYAAGSAPQAFDEAERAARVQALQMQNLLWLELEPGLEVNREIDRILHDDEVERAMAVLGRRVGEGRPLSWAPSADAVAGGVAGRPVVDATEAHVDLADPIAAAKKRLAMPRYQSLSRRLSEPEADRERG